MATRVETEPIAATRRRPPRRRVRIPWGSIVKHGILLFCCVIILFPLFWVFLLSIKSLPDAYTNHIWPNDFEFGSYRTALTAVDTLPQNIQNSIVLTLTTMLITTTVAVLAGYALVHLPTPGKRLVLAILVASLFVPSRVTGSDLDLGDPGPARADQLDLGADPPVPDARAGGQHLHHARRLRDDSERAARIGARRRRELVHDPAPDHAPARPQRRHRRPDHELHRGVGGVAAREHAHQRPGEAAADGRDRRRRTPASASGSGRRWRRCSWSRSCPA